MVAFISNKQDDKQPQFKNDVTWKYNVISSVYLYFRHSENNGMSFFELTIIQTKHALSMKWPSLTSEMINTPDFEQYDFYAGDMLQGTLDQTTSFINF